MIMNREPIGTNLGRLADKYIFENPPKYWDDLLVKMTDAAKAGQKQIIINNKNVFDNICHNIYQYKLLCETEKINYYFDDEDKSVYFGW